MVQRVHTAWFGGAGVPGAGTGVEGAGGLAFRTDMWRAGHLRSRSDRSGRDWRISLLCRGGPRLILLLLLLLLWLGGLTRGLWSTMSGSGWGPTGDLVLITVGRADRLARPRTLGHLPTWKGGYCRAARAWVRQDHLAEQSEPGLAADLDSARSLDANQPYPGADSDLGRGLRAGTREAHASRGPVVKPRSGAAVGWTKVDPWRPSVVGARAAAVPVPVPVDRVEESTAAVAGPEACVGGGTRRTTMDEPFGHGPLAVAAGVAGGSASWTRRGP